ncbi:family S53 protease [Gloeopeniophorella convolvens]|nr:family S53 protease [Gloeopeniophorella convolvens]
MARSFFIASLLASVVLATPHFQRDMSVHGRRESVPSGFVHNGPAPNSHVLTLRLGLAQNNFAGLKSAVYAASTPGSPQFRQHLTKQEVDSFVVPSADTSSAVTEWLSEHGLTAKATTPAGDWLQVSMTVEQANKLLNTQFSTFTDTSNGQQTVRTLQYSVPSTLKSHISFVHPTTNFPVKLHGSPIIKSSGSKTPFASRGLSSRAAPSSCDNIINPTCLQEQYGVPSTAGANSSQNVLGVTGFIEEWANQADLQLFLSNLRQDISPSSTFGLLTVDEGSNPQGESQAGVEANLDTQYTVGVATGIQVEFISVGEFNEDGLSGFLDVIELLLSAVTPPTVLTTSYSFNEEDLDFEVASPLCNAYAQLTALGTTILFSSGDGGVSGGQASSCTTFVPTFPSTCEFITSVGSTANVDPEVAADFSSGGFSNLFPIPDYQADAVASYLAGIGDLNTGLFNPSGRAFPDISLAGQNFEIAWQQEFFLVDGTSCSTPSLASFISLINDRSIAAGQPTVGFLNPLLYANIDKFTDITSGTNPGCGTNGFPAAAGWDPITGVGSPVFSNLLELVGL